MPGGRLKDKVAIITGGAGGIGSACAALFCREGAQVAIVDQDHATIQAALSSIREKVPDARVAGFIADLSVEMSAQTVVDEIAAHFGPKLDILVNNVGIRRFESVADASWDTWDKILKVNFLSFVSMARAALPALRQSGRASIVNVSSIVAHHGRTGSISYDATKTAILALTRTLALEEGEHGVRANSVCPGYTRTPFHVNRLGAEVVDAFEPACVMKRWAEPEEIAYPMLWLASDEASYITGAYLAVDGGFHMKI